MGGTIVQKVMEYFAMLEVNNSVQISCEVYKVSNCALLCLE